MAQMSPEVYRRRALANQPPPPPPPQGTVPPAPVPAPQAPAPPAPGQAPVPPPPPAVNPAQQQAGQAVPPPPPPPPNRPLGTDGGQRATADMTAADIQAQVDTTIPVEQFQAYINEGHLDPSCPPNTPFRQDKAHIDKWFGGQGYDPNACVEKPVDQVGGAGGAGGAGGPGGRGGRGGRGAGRGGAGGRGLEGGANMEIWNQIKADLQGGPSRYSDEAIAALEADNFARTRRQEELQLEEARRDAAIRGTSRSGGQAAALRDIRSGAGQQILANRADIQKRKIDADFEDRQAAINNSMNWLNSLRDYMLRTDMNAIQREQMSAQIAMANKQLAWQTSENNRAHQRRLQERSIFDPNSPV